MTRGMILPTCGDPYITQGWVDNYSKFYSKYVDKLHVFVNSMAPDPVFDFVVQCFRDVGANVIEKRHISNHGKALTRLVNESNEETLFFTEEDFLIFQSSVVDNWYKSIESGQFGLIGSMRGCCEDELIKACARKFNLQGKEAQQPNFWPVPVLVNRSNILKTDLQFIGPRHKGGVLLPEINHTPSRDMGGGDTFAWMSMQLRAQGLKVNQVRQYRFRSGNKDYPWIHLGGGSTSLNGFLFDEHQVPIGRQTVPVKPRLPDAGLVEVLERRVGWWKAMRMAYPIPDSHPASYFNKVYLDALERCPASYKIRKSEIDRYAQTCRKLINK